MPLLSGSEADAVDRYIASCTVPIVEELGDKAAVLGTGNVFEVLGRFFIVSASHSFEDFDPDRVGVLARTVDGRRAYLTLNNCTRYYWPDDGLDVTVIEVPNGPLLADLRRTYQCLVPEAIAPHGQQFSEYVIVGYPRDVAVVGPGSLEPRVIKITSTLFEGALPSNFRRDREFLLAFDKYGWDEKGNRQESVRLHGVSGAAVWGIVGPSQVCGLWSARTSARVTGVQIACKEDSYIRCHQWWLLARMFEKIEATIGAEFMAVLKSSSR